MEKLETRQNRRRKMEEDRQRMEEDIELIKEGLQYIKRNSERINIDNFYGDFIKLPEFINQYEIAATANDWTNAEKAKRFPVYLRGLALEAYQNVPISERDDWEKMSNAFKSNIVTDDIALLYSRKFKTRRQLPGESIAEYAFELKKLAKRAFPDLEDEQLDYFLMDQFIDGVDRTMQETLIDKDYDTYTELTKKAQAIEYRRQLLNMPKYSDTVCKVKEDDKPNKKIKLETDFRNYEDRVNDKMDYFCEKCKKYGHLTRACRQLISIKPQTKNVYENNFNKRGFQGNNFNNYKNNFGNRPKMDFNNRFFENKRPWQNRKNYGYNFRNQYQGNYRQTNNNFSRSNMKGNYLENRSNSRERNTFDKPYSRQNRNSSPYARGSSFSPFRRNNQEGTYRSFNKYYKSPVRNVRFKDDSENPRCQENKEDDEYDYILNLEEEIKSMKIQMDREQYNTRNRNNGNDINRIKDKNTRTEELLNETVALLKNELQQQSTLILSLKPQSKDTQRNVTTHPEKFDFSQQYDVDSESSQSYHKKAFTYKISFLNVLMAILFLISLSIPNITAIKAYDCRKPEFGNEYSLLDVERCPDASPTRLVQKEEIYNVYQESTLISLMVTECRMRSAEIIFHCGHVSHTSIRQTQVLDKTEELTSMQCLDAANLKMIKLTPEVVIRVHINATTRETLMLRGRVGEKGKCEGERYKINGVIESDLIVAREYEITITQYTASFDTQTGVMLTNGYTMCKVEHNYCQTGISTLIYTYVPPPCQLIFLESATFIEIHGKQAKFGNAEQLMPDKFENSTATEKVIEMDTQVVLMSKEDNIIRLIKKEPQVKCNKKVYTTSYDNLYVSRHKIADAQPKIKPVDLRQYYYFNNKIDFAYHKLLETVEAVYHDTIISDCRIHREVLRTKLAMTITNPDIATPLLSAELGLFGRVAGEVLYTFRCKSIDVTIRQEIDRCTNELPVTYGAQALYLEPVTRTITLKPTVIPCNNPLVAKFQLNPAVWISIPDQKMVTAPLTLELPKLQGVLQFKDLTNLAKKGLYTTKQLEEASRYILFPRERSKILTIVARQSTQDMKSNPDFELLLSPDHFKRATASYLKMIWGKFLFFGQIFSGFFGLYVTFIFLKILFQQVLSTYTMYKVFGFTWRLIAGCCPFISKLLLIRHCHTLIRKDRHDRRPFPDNSREDLLDNIEEIPLTSEPKQSVEIIKMDEHQSVYKSSSKQDMQRQQKESTQSMGSQTALYPNLNCYSIFDSKHKCPVIQIKINGKPAMAVVDTGASVSLVDESYLDNANDLLFKVKKVPTSASGHEIKTLGKALCTFKVFDETITMNTIITPKQFEEVLLGMDLLSKLTNKYIDLKTGLLISIPRNDLEALKHYKELSVKNDGDIIIPPWSEKIAYVKIPFDKAEEILFEPSKGLMTKYTLPMSTTLCIPNDSKIPIRMLNLTNKDLEIKENTTLGTASNIDSVMTTSIDDKMDKLPFITFEKSSISIQMKNKLYQLLKKYKAVFAKDEYDLGRTNVLKHEIPLESTTPIKQRPYRMEYALREESEKQIKGMLENDIIKPSFSPWTSPVVMVRKKDGTMRFCIDYRKLNAATIKDTYPLPRIDEMLDKLHNSQFFTTMDLQSGFWQIEVAEEDKYKTAFSTGQGLYEFNVLPFGLTGAPPTFQRCMNIILMDASHAMVYIDDILIYSTTFEEHLKDIETVLIRLKNAGLKLKPSKCEWAKNQISFLGHIISKDGIKPDPKNTNKIAEQGPLKNVKEVQRFLGIASYYRKFIKNFAKIANPLNQLLTKGNKFNWTTECDEALSKLKAELTNPPILKFPDFNKPFLIMTDASAYAIGAVLSQNDENEKDHPIAYASRSLKPHEKNYSTIEREALALVYATKQFRHYIWSKEITLLTDHKPLQWLMSHKDTSSRLIRWALNLQDLNINIKYRTGKNNANADFLSRIDGDMVAAVLQTVPLNEKLIEEQEKDIELQVIKKYLEKGIIDENAPQLLIKHLKLKGYQYNFKKKILYFRDGTNNLVVVPTNFRQILLIQYHDGALGGHLSSRKVLSKLKQKYHWPTMLADVKTWCKTCKICMSRKNTIKNQVVPLKPIKPPKAPMETTAMDIVGPLPMSMLGNKYILVFSDYLTKWPEAIAIPDQKAETIAKIFVEKIIFSYGAPKRIITDQGTNFMSDLLKAICELFDIIKLNTSPYHPQTDGLVERFNGTLLNMLSSYTNTNQSDWDIHIPSCLFAYRTAVHPATGESPFFLMFGRDTYLPIDHLIITQVTHLQDDPNYKDVITEQITQAWRIARQNILYSQESYKDYYDKKAKDHTYKIGDRVLLYTVQAKKGKTNKLYRPYQGPYRIISITDTNLKIIPIFKPNAEAITVHVNRCRPAPLENSQFREIEKMQKVNNKTNLPNKDKEEKYNLRPRIRAIFEKKLTDKLNYSISSNYSMMGKFNLILILLIFLINIQIVSTNNFSEYLDKVEPLKEFMTMPELYEHWRRCCLYCLNFNKCHDYCIKYSREQFMMLTYATQRIPKSIKCLKICFRQSIEHLTKLDLTSKFQIQMTSTMAINIPIQHVPIQHLINKILWYNDYRIQSCIIVISFSIILIIISILMWRKSKRIPRFIDNFKKPPTYQSGYLNNFESDDLRNSIFEPPDVALDCLLNDYQMRNQVPNSFLSNDDISTEYSKITQIPSKIERMYQSIIEEKMKEVFV